MGLVYRWLLNWGAVLVLLGVISTLVSLLYFERSGGPSETILDQPIVLRGNASCDPSGAYCAAVGSKLTIEIGFSGDEDIRPLVPFPVEVRLGGVDAVAMTRVIVDLSMSGMEMGVNRFILKQVSDGVWQGQAMLPICSAGRRDWLVVVETARTVNRPSYKGEFSLVIGAGSR